MTGLVDNSSVMISPAGTNSFEGEIALFVLLIVAVLGAAYAAVFHVMSLLGFTVVTLAPHLLGMAVCVLPGVIGVLAHASMNNALRGPGVVAVTSRQIARGLTRTEWVLSTLGVIYASIAILCLWPYGRREIVLDHDLTVDEARTAWAFCLLFGISGITLALSAMRVCRGVKP